MLPPLVFNNTCWQSDFFSPFQSTSRSIGRSYLAPDARLNWITDNIASRLIRGLWDASRKSIRRCWRRTIAFGRSRKILQSWFIFERKLETSAKGERGTSCRCNKSPDEPSVKTESKRERSRDRSPCRMHRAYSIHCTVDKSKGDVSEEKETCRQRIDREKVKQSASVSRLWAGLYERKIEENKKVYVVDFLTWCEHTLLYSMTQYIHL